MPTRFMTLAAAAVIALAAPSRAQAAIIVAGFEPPTYSGSTATVGVTFAFSGNPGDTLEAFQLSLIGSDPLLTAAGTDFSRFTFTPNASLLTGWGGTPDAFGADGYVFYSTFGGGLAPSATPYQLGTLTVDLTGLNPPTPPTLTLNGQDSFFPTSAAGTISGTFDPIPLDASGATMQLQASPVPEPGSAVLLATGVGVMALFRRRLIQEPDDGVASSKRR